MLEPTTVAGMRAALEDPLGLGEPPAVALARAQADANSLAQRAYSEGDPDALRTAEHLLYLVHVESRFAAPVHALAASVWGPLMRAKLAATIAAYGGTPPLSEGELVPALQQAVSELGAYNHPLLDDMAVDTGTRRIELFTKNWYGSTHGFTEELGALVQRCAGVARRVIVENLADELDGVTHETLRTSFFERLGLEFDASAQLDDRDRVTESFALLNLRAGLCALRDSTMALGCFWTMEANWPDECRRHVSNLRKRGFREDELEYWHVHATGDEEHTRTWLAMLVEVCDTPERRAAAVDGAVIHLHTRRRMYDAIRALASSS